MKGSDASTENTDRFIFYHYHPSLAAAVIFQILFFLTTLLHIYQAYRKRAWFLIPLIIGGMFEVGGYVGRILSSKDQWALGPFLVQSLLLLLAPALFAASIYMILGRIILLVDGEHYSIIKRTWLTKIFVGGDILSFLVQGNGSGIMASGDPGKMKTGRYIIIGGLVLQVFFFGLFVLVAVIFQRRAKSHLARLSKHVPWKQHLYTLYSTSIFILVRSVFRMIEYVQGDDGFLFRHEAFLYIFDALLMLMLMFAMNWANPGHIALMLKEGAGGTGSVQLHEIEASRERMVNTRTAWV